MTALASVPDPLRTVFVLGIDPGPSTGIALLRLNGRNLAGDAEAYQCNAAAAPWLLNMLAMNAICGNPARGGIEGFAPGRGPGGGMYSARVSRQVQELAGICAQHGIPLQARYATLVKTWATDKRLREAGLYELTAGGAHSRDAARHALFAACHDCGYPDPLSKKAVSR